ncbi:hypothetical protein BC830DRAFT_1144109, partial [Chytriomyces sp. MP71]
MRWKAGGGQGWRGGVNTGPRLELTRLAHCLNTKEQNMSSCQRLVKFALGGEKGRRGCEEGRVLGVFPCETWLRVVSLLAVNESCAALARCSTAFRGVGVLRSALLARMLALEPVRSLRGFAHDQQVVSSVSVSEHSGSASHAVQWTGPGGADQNTSTEITSNSWADPLLLHKHIDAFLRRALGDEPERYTDVFSEWVHYNPNLPDQELFELRDMWERKAGGARGRSVARDHVEWEGAYNRMSKELKRDLCLIWAVLGKMFPFTKQENAAWREARATRIVVNTKATPEFRGGSIAVHNDVGSGYKSKSRERMVHNADTIPKWNGTGHQGKGRRSSSSATSTPTLSAWTTAKSISTSPEFESDEFERDHCQNDATTPTKGGKGKRCNLRNNSTNRRANCRGSSRSSCIRNACHSEAPESDEEDYDTSDNRHVPPKSPKFSTSAPSSSTPTLTTKRKHSVPASAATILPPPAPTHSPSSTAVPIAIPPTTRSLSTSSTASSSTATLLDVPSPYFNPSTPSGMLLTPASPQPRSILRKISKTTPRDGLPPLSM